MRDPYMLVRRGFDRRSEKYVKRHDAVLAVGDKAMLEAIAMLLRIVDAGPWASWARPELRGYFLDKEWLVIPFSHTLPDTKEGAPEE